MLISQKMPPNLYLKPIALPTGFLNKKLIIFE